ncbi:MAG: T9SS type A sorting domain-containing protein [Ignavibacteriaceae bacterium]|nr:T9SS type A sorting domain-containing protein [Ignavibacteriaceae bacterium]
MLKFQYKFVLLVFALLFTTTQINAQAVVDPQSLPVYASPTAITLDGQLNESGWAADVPHLMFKKDGVPSGNANTPTAGAEVKPPYTDISTARVKFLRVGFNLYIGIDSDDKQVCRFDWEGDGMFMKIKNASGANEYEIKNYVGLVSGVPAFVFETNAPAGVCDGVGFAKTGTTIYDSSNNDNGYSLETIIRLDQLGFTDPLAQITLMINIFDPDNYSLNAPPWGPNGNFYKQWWGSEWGGTYRTLQLNATTVPVELTSFSAIPTNGGVQLKWSTASESNNSGFEVQRSIDNSNFVSLSFVNGRGTTTETTEYAFLDKNEISGVYYYRLKQVDFDGRFEYSNTVEVDIQAPVEFNLSQNYPNPFNPSTTISFGLPVASQVQIVVFDLLGREVSTIVNETFARGTHQVVFNASKLASGTYVYQITSLDAKGNKQSIAKLMSLLK